jgi:hypothetical protein
MTCRPTWTALLYRRRQRQREHRPAPGLALGGELALQQNQRGDFLSPKEFLQTEDLLAVASRIAAQHPDAADRIQNEPHRPQPGDDLADPVHDLLQFHLVGGKDAVIGSLRGRRLRIAEVGDLDAVQRPAMTAGYLSYLRLGFGEAEEDTSFPFRGALHQELEADRRLARAGFSLNQEAAARGPAAVENRVEARDPGMEASLSFHGGARHQMSVRSAGERRNGSGPVGRTESGILYSAKRMRNTERMQDAVPAIIAADEARLPLGLRLASILDPETSACRIVEAVRDWQLSCHRSQWQPNSLFDIDGQNCERSRAPASWQFPGG